MGKMLKIAVVLCAMFVLSNALFRHRPRCGRRTYNPRSQLCCSGRVRTKFGISPGCCGTDVYDHKFQICCSSRRLQRYGIRPSCCGRRVYDAAFYKCVRGRVVHK